MTSLQETMDIQFESVYQRTLLKSGQLTIPRNVQTLLDYEYGDYLYIYISNKYIVISKHHTNTTLNQCVFNNNRISIPKEIRRILKITAETLLEIKVSKEKESIFINPL
ncbi:hypothetical protein ACIQLG_17040 [Terribacillus saccharophilus]|uniref:hypothetical protein n=1 Tax=Terribacillus saccharophilus TaxID=361277 RepID=UPI0038308726